MNILPILKFECLKQCGASFIFSGPPKNKQNHAWN